MVRRRTIGARAREKEQAPFRAPIHDHQHCIDGALARAERICAARGLRLTALRRRILEMIWRRHQPVGAYDLLAMLADGQRRAAPPTVYRALAFLLGCGLIHRIESLNAYVGCNDPDAPHSGQFLICRDCRNVGELDDPEIGRALRRGVEATGFRPDRQTIEITGLCPNCATGDG
jgi:Fur family transcriptional regulator, zinc uptake regulator